MLKSGVIKLAKPTLQFKPEICAGMKYEMHGYTQDRRLAL